MMQKVQRWSQPFCTCTKARVRPRMPSMRCSGGLAHRHDVVDDDLLAVADAEIAAAAQVSAFSFSSLPMTRRPPAWPRRSAGSICARAAGDDDPRVRAARGEPADRLPRLAHRFGGHRAGVDDHDVVEPGGLGVRAASPPLVGVEPAAEGDDVDLDAHHAAPAKQRRRASTPSCSSSTGPVISTWPSLSRHSIDEVAARQRHRGARGPVSRLRDAATSGRAGGRAAGARQPGAALPDAQQDAVRRDDLRRARYWRARGRSGGSRAAARCGRDRRPRRRRPRRSRAGCPC